MMKLAFFDVDGTLSAPRYLDRENGRFVIGFTDAAWLSFCGEYGKDAYRDCAPLACVADYAKKLKETGCRLFVLSATACETEAAAKRVFLERFYAGLFEECFFVANDAEKITKITEIAGKEGCGTGDCALVEDTYSVLLKAHNSGICAIHVANIVSGNISC